MTGVQTCALPISFQFQVVYTNLAPVPDTLWFLTAEDQVKGKITQLHNYLNYSLSLNYVEQIGTAIPWYVDSMSVSALPHVVNPGDSVAVRVKMHLSRAPGFPFVVDSLEFTTTSGTYHVIIMVNSWLLASSGEQTSMAEAGANYPNPFSDMTNIPLTVRQRGPVSLKILDIRGNEITTLVSGVLEPGTRTIRWNGTDNRGHKLPGGIYLYRLTTGNSTETRKLVLTD